MRKNYVYFKSRSAEYKDWAEAETALSNVQLELADITKLNQVVNFIGQVAENERIKELHSISDYFSQYKNKLSLLKNGSRLMSLINNPTQDIKQLDKFYEDFVLALNLAKKGTEETLTRIKTIQQNINDTSRTLTNYQEDDFRFAIGKTLTNLLNRITGQYQINLIDSNSLDSKIHDIVIDILLAANIPEKIASGEDFAAIASIVLIDIEKRAQKMLDEYMKNDSSVKSFRDIADEIFPQIKKEYLDAINNNKPLTEVQQSLLNLDESLNDNGLNTAIRNTEEILNIHLSDNIALGRTRLKKIESTYSRGIKEEARNIESRIDALRSRVLKNNQLSDSLFRLEFTKMDSNSAHGNLNELIEGLFGEKVRANVATDLITYTYGYEIKYNDNLLNNFMHEISEELSSIGDYLSSTKNKDNFQNVLSQVNEHITQTINKLEQFLADNSIDDKVFIQHETLKLSVLAEKEGHSFKGRTMSIFSYIDYLASSGGSTVDSDDLKFIAYNLIPGAIAEKSKGPLEKYFSLFAGMLMFDDVANMGTEAINQVQSLSNSGQVEQLHLYNLNGVYVPASMILEYTFQGMQELSAIAENGYAAQARIILSSGANKRKLVERVKEASKTKVNIVFLSGFTNLIQRIINFQ